MAATKHKAPSIILSEGALAALRAKKLRYSNILMSILITKDELLPMLLKTKTQIINYMLEKLNDDDPASDAYSSSSTRLSGESLQSEKPVTTGSKKAQKTVDAVCSDYAVDDAIRRSETQGEKQWLKKRNTKT